MANQKRFKNEETPYNPLLAKVDGSSYSRDYESLPLDVLVVERAATTVDGIAIIVTLQRRRLNTARSKHWYWTVVDLRTTTA